MTAVPDIEPIAPAEGTLTVNGIEVRVRHVKIREMLLLMRVASVAPGMFEELDFDDKEGMAAQLLGMLVVALPYAVEESLAFFKEVCEPINPDDADKLRESFDNPEPGDVLDILSVMIDQEQDNLFEMWGKARLVAQKLQTVSRKRKQAGTGDPSPAPST